MDDWWAALAVLAMIAYVVWDFLTLRFPGSQDVHVAGTYPWVGPGDTAIPPRTKRVPRAHLRKDYPTRLYGPAAGETRRVRILVERSPDGRALYAAAVKGEADKDDLPRLVFADWLQDNGFDGTAAHVREVGLRPKRRRKR